MVRSSLAALALLSALTLLPAEADAYGCGRGAYRAGCVGPNGAVVARRPPAYYGRPGGYYGRPPGYYGRPTYYRGGYYRRPPAVACGSGPYRSGCVRRY